MARGVLEAPSHVRRADEQRSKWAVVAGDGVARPRRHCAAGQNDNVDVKEWRVVAAAEGQPKHEPLWPNTRRCSSMPSVSAQHEPSLRRGADVARRDDGDALGRKLHGRAAVALFWHVHFLASVVAQHPVSATRPKHRLAQLNRRRKIGQCAQRRAPARLPRHHHPVAHGSGTCGNERRAHERRRTEVRRRHIAASAPKARVYARGPRRSRAARTISLPRNVEICGVRAQVQNFAKHDGQSCFLRREV